MGWILTRFRGIQCGEMIDRLRAADKRLQIGDPGDHRDNTMKLCFLRHGIAIERGTPGMRDDERPLTEEGCDKTRQVAAALETLRVKFDLILSSPNRRARQTAEIVAAVLDAKKVVRFSDHLAPGGSLQGLVNELNRENAGHQDVLLVGHEPDFSQHIAVLTSGKPALQLEMKKAGLCRLEVASLRAGRCATLEWLLPPKLLIRLK
jgi:phosphohistidine phosphatase